MKQENTLIISSNFEEIANVEPFLKETISQSDDESFNYIQLAVTEAVSNAIVHGNREVASKEVEIVVTQNDDQIEITVEDEGNGFVPESIPNPTANEQLLKEGGRGVFLIKHYADEVSFEKRGTLIRMHFFK